MPSKEESTVPRTTAVSTRDRLIDVGLDRMRRRGYGAAGLQEILQSAEVPKGSFYHHFSSKEEFAAAVVERYFTLAADHSRQVLGNKRQAPLKLLRRYFEDLIGMAGPSAPIQGCLLGSLSLEVASSSPLLRGSISSSFAHWQATVAATLHEAIERGDLPKSTKVDSLAGFILNSWEGALLRSQADKSDAPLKDFLHYTFEVLLTL